MLIYEENSELYKRKCIWKKGRETLNQRSFHIKHLLPLTSQEIPSPRLLHTRTATDGLVARVTPPNRNQAGRGGRFFEVAVLKSWFASESPGMLGKCRFPDPALAAQI